MAKKQPEGGGLIAQIQKAIRESGKSLSQLGKEARVTQPQLSRFLRGERTLTLPAAEKLCEALGLGLVPLSPTPLAQESAALVAQPGEAPEGKEKPKRGRKAKG